MPLVLVEHVVDQLVPAPAHDVVILAALAQVHLGPIERVVVAPRASELIFPVALAVANRLSVDQVASTFTVYPSLSGSVTEAARKLHHRAT